MTVLDGKCTCDVSQQKIYKTLRRLVPLRCPYLTIFFESFLKNLTMNRFLKPLTIHRHHLTASLFIEVEFLKH